MRARPQASVVRSQFVSSNIARPQLWRPAFASRGYATEPESKEGESTPANGKAEGEAEDPLKKELDSMNKEIIELKVSLI